MFNKLPKKVRAEESLVVFLKHKKAQAHVSCKNTLTACLISVNQLALFVGLFISCSRSSIENRIGILNNFTCICSAYEG